MYMYMCVIYFHTSRPVSMYIIIYSSLQLRKWWFIDFIMYIAAVV